MQESRLRKDEAVMFRKTASPDAKDDMVDEESWETFVQYMLWFKYGRLLRGYNFQWNQP